jgi:hypothetical protein
MFFLPHFFIPILVSLLIFFKNLSQNLKDLTLECKVNYVLEPKEYLRNI